MRQSSKNTPLLPVVDVPRLLKRLVVFALIGNADAQKYISLLETANGLGLSPCYDVINSVLYANLGATARFRLAIFDRFLNHEEVYQGVLTGLGRSFNLVEKAIKLYFQAVEEKKSDCLDWYLIKAHCQVHIRNITRIF